MSMRLGVLFMQSQAFFGADSAIHAELMKHFDRREVDVHVACTTEEPSNPAVSAVRRLSRIPDLHLRPTLFGPSIHGIRREDQVRRLAGLPAVAASLLSLAWYIRKHRIKVIHATEKPRDAFYGVLLAKLTGARSVVHMHVGYGDWQSRMVKWALGQADGIVAISQFVADSIVAAGYPRDRIQIVHNALDVTDWDPSIDGASVREELGLPQDAPVVGIISRLFRWKGHAQLVDALALVKETIPNVKLVIVGEDDPRADPGSGSFRAQLEQQVERLGLQDNVLFTGFRTDIPRMVAALDVFAHPSWEEPFGMVFLEAMAMKKPVVCWDSGGAPEVIQHGITGLLVERGSIPGLAEALTKLLGDPDLRRRLGQAGRERAAQVFSPQRMCQTMLEAYRSILAGGHDANLGKVARQRAKV
jgi:glycosyltransferase involved in cell wall biosynthesis